MEIFPLIKLFELIVESLSLRGIALPRQIVEILFCDKILEFLHNFQFG